MSEDAKAAMDGLLATAGDVYEAWAAAGGEGAADAAIVAGALCAPQAYDALEPVGAPVLRHLPAALDRAAAGPHGGLIAALLEALGVAAPHLAWGQLPSYRDTMPREFLDGYAHVNLLGRGGHYPDDRARCGLLLFGPDIDYPAHSHPARELYLVLDGTAEWWRDGEDPVKRPPGSLLLHSEGRSHAMRMAADGLLALWAWTGDLETEAAID
ncbi:MAG: cupin domain-containing protein [Rhodospirillaceae bacterium]|jgi:mannose-6-phosphate isomerase-like protein (cupin superfamily)|nr:cupin domain-containing protein [Rhodospirillaceae bacterium]